MIIGLLGNLGRGKTLTMVFLIGLLLEETRIDNVVTNFRTDFTTHQVSNPQELDNVSQRDNFQAIYGLDEIWAWINARTAMENFDMIEFVLNSRKRGCVIIYTTQSDKQVDPILTDNTDYLAVPFHREDTETELNHDTVEIYIVDKETYEVVNRMVVDAETFYGTYDTTEEVSTVSKSEQYEELIGEYRERVADEEFKYKKELVSHLHMKEDMSEADSVRITDMIFRELRNEGVIDDTRKGE